MRVHLICPTHNTTALVGPGTLISELECVVCIEEQDEANAWRPCCSRANTTCCGHDDYADESSFQVRIDSPNFCDVDHERESADVPF
jgi:hypothetical protein